MTTGSAKQNQTGPDSWLGGIINYLEDCGKPTADLLTIKLMLNSIISMQNVKFMTMDIKKFYLNTPLKWYEYLHLKLADIPPDVIEWYALQEKATMAGYMWRYAKECLACPRQDYWHKSYWRNSWQTTNIIKANTPLGCGDMTQGTFSFVLLLMIFTSNMSAETMLNI